MGIVEDIGPWRARRALRVEQTSAVHDVSMGAPPFVLEEACPGCGAERVGEMVWRLEPGKSPLPLPRIAPHFLCRDDVVVFQDVTDSPEPASSWKRILGRFQVSGDRGSR